jgi:hypothetical protein
MIEVISGEVAWLGVLVAFVVEVEGIAAMVGSGIERPWT